MFSSDHSAGVNSREGFQSALAKSPDSSSDSVTLEQHANDLNRAPTPWISTTNQLFRAILHAVKLAEVHEISGVSIAIIAVSRCRANPPSKTSELRYRYQLRYEAWHNHEFLFRWEIPGRAVVSCLSLQTLVDRGLYTMLPQVLVSNGVDECMEAIIEEWEETRNKSKYRKRVGVKAAGLHTYLAAVRGQSISAWHGRVEGWVWALFFSDTQYSNSSRDGEFVF